jgi:outer membrane protein TolC
MLEHGQEIAAARAEVGRLLSKNRKRRTRAASELDEAREELRDLLGRGDKLGLPVAEMARIASVSRETAHKLLRDVRSQEGEG